MIFVMFNNFLLYSNILLELLENDVNIVAE